MFPILNLGPLAIQAPGLILLAGLYVAVLVVEKQSKHFTVSANDMTNLLFTYLISTVILGRLAYILEFPAVMLEKPLSIISLNPNLFDFPSGLVLSILIALIFIQRKNLNLNEVLEALALPLLIFLVFFFFAQYASGNLFGKPSSLPWSIQLWGTSRHPLQLYYIIGLIPIVFLTIKNMKSKNSQRFLLLRSLSYLSFLVIFLDFFNGDPNNLIGNINELQLIAFIAFLIFSTILNLKIRKPQAGTN